MGDYVFTEKYCIGQGSFGKVYRGRNIKTGRDVAIKEMDGQLISEKDIGREITILKGLKHPNIVEYEDAFQVNQRAFRTMATFILSLSIARAETCAHSLMTATRKITRIRRKKYWICFGKSARGSGI